MLLGLKENVIIGKLVPTGTGMDVYNNVEVVKNEAFIDHAHSSFNRGCLLGSHNQLW